ncbi:hypothetical protein GGI13_004132 [Coemansia sp. RSA 455]|nr:hypothetical protein GGI13_004132 [Coemansia sp. RSA 455]
MFSDLYSSSSFYSPLQAKILLAAPISTPIAIHQKPTVDLPAALLTDRACSDLFGFLDDVSQVSGSSSSADASTSAASPTDDVKPEPTSSKKHVPKDTAPPFKRLKLAENVEVKAEHVT